MSLQHAPIFIVIVPLATALLIPFLGLGNARGARSLTLLAIFASLFFSAMCLRQSLRSGAIHYHVGGWAPPPGIELVLDPLSGFIATLVSAIAFLAAFYSGPYLAGWTVGRF